MATNSLPALRGAPPSSSLPIKKAPTHAPNQTLYITNLPSSKIQKQDLRLYLYTLFTTYGPVLDVVALKTMKMRGQAHVTMRDLASASQAMRALNGMEFLGREMQIQYAKTKSDTIAKLDGTFNRPKEAAGVGASTELQKSIFDGPQAAINNAATATTTTNGSTDAAVVPARGEDSGSPAVGSVAGQKRRREDEEEEEGKEEEEDDGSGSDVAMEEDSDDD